MSSAPAPSPTYPILNGNNFNNDFFTNTTGNLSLENAFKFFLRLTGGTISGSLVILQNLNVSGNSYLQDLYLNNIKVNSTATELNYLNSVVLGVAQVNKALTLNNLGNVSGINILSANELTALNGVNVEGGHLTLSASSHLKINSLSDASATTNASIYTKGGVYIEKSLTALQNINSNTLSTTGLISTTFTNNTTNLISYQTWKNDLATDINVQLYMSNIGSSIGTSSNHPFRLLANNSNHLVCDGSGNVNILNHNSTVGLQLNSVLVTASATQLNYNDITTIGTAEASKALILDSSRNITNINNLTATNLTALIQTSAQPNITSTGNLTIPNNITITNGSNALNISNTSGANFRLNIQNVGGHCDLGSNNSFDFSLMTNATRRLTINGSTGAITNISSLTGGNIIMTDNSGINADKTFRWNNNIVDVFTTKFDTASATLIFNNDVYFTGVRFHNSGSYILYDDYPIMEWTNSELNSDLRLRLRRQFVSGVTYRYQHAFKSNKDLGFEIGGAQYDYSLLLDSTNNSVLSKQLRIDSSITRTANVANLDIQCDNTKVDGANYSRAVRFTGSNANPCNVEIQINRNAVATTVASYIGSINAHKFGIMTNNSARLTIDSSNAYVGIGTASPNCPLDVTGTASLTFGAGGLNVYSYTGTSGTWVGTGLGLGPVFQNITARFSSNITCGSIIQTSDRRLKKNIKNLEMDFEKFYNIDVVEYDMLKYPQHDIGLIAQDVLNNGFQHLVAFTPNEELKSEDEVLIDGMQLNLKYDRIAVINMAMIKKMLDRIKKLEDFISSLDIVEE